MDARKISLCLTHFNRYEFIIECFAQVLHDERISEIVIQDDCSTDGSYQALIEHFKNQPKVKFFRNETNVDCYVNKKNAVQSAMNEWVIIFDSDNVITPDYLDAIFLIEQWETRVAYCPVFARPNFDYTAFAGQTIDHINVARAMNEHRFSTALNTMNYFVNRFNYLDCWDGAVNPHTADSIFQNYNWLKSANALYFVPRLTYFHRVHEGSHWKNNYKKTGNFLKEVEVKLRNLK